MYFYVIQTEAKVLKACVERDKKMSLKARKNEEKVNGLAKEGSRRVLYALVLRTITGEKVYARRGCIEAL